MKEINLLLMGDSAVGKTSLLNRLFDDTFETNNLKTIQPITKSKYFVKYDKKINYIDTPANLINVKKKILNADVYFLVYDVTNQKTIDNLESYIKQIYESNDNPNLYIIGNKNENMDDIVKAHDIANKYDAKYFTISSKTRSGINELFSSLIIKSN